MDAKRIYYLDGLRGILAIIVFVHHFLYAFFPEVVFGGTAENAASGHWNLIKIIALTPINILFNPGMAINFFFLLSGYVQTFNYFKTNEYSYLQKSFLKRYFRLAIPTLAVVLIVYIFHKLHFIKLNFFPQNTITSTWVKSMLPDSLNFLQAIKFGLLDCFNSDFKYYQILWTMPVELLNSLIILILLLVTHNLKNKLNLFIVWAFIQFTFLKSFHGLAFTFGMILCYLQANSAEFKKIMSHKILKLILLSAGIYFASYPFVAYNNVVKNTVYGPISFFETNPTVISYLFGNTLLFCFIVYSERIKKIMSHKILQFFGAISYMFYLIHFILVFGFSPWIFHSLSKNINGAPLLIITGTITFAVITLLSWLLTSLIDKPILKVCNYYSNKLYKN